MKTETYKTARDRLLSELDALGWETRPKLKTPWADSPHRAVRLWFRPQAIWFGPCGQPIGEARSLWVGPRGLEASRVIRIVRRDLGVEP